MLDEKQSYGNTILCQSRRNLLHIKNLCAGLEHELSLLLMTIMKLNLEVRNNLTRVATHILHRKHHPCTEHALHRLAERKTCPNNVSLHNVFAVYYCKEKKRFSFVCQKYIYVFSLSDKTLITILNNHGNI